jgi:hypothetical protein
MAKIAVFVLIAAVVIVVTATIVDPAMIDDRNPFLATFVPNELLNVLGVVLAIFLPSAAGLYLKLSELGRGDESNPFSSTKTQIWSSVIIIILLFISTVVILIIKGLGPGEGRWGAFFNGLALVLLLAHILVLFDITRAVFVVADRES